MKRMIFTLLLAIVSSVWMTNKAGNWCMPSVRTLTNPWIEVNGTFQAEGIPCEPDEECPPCLTIVLVTSDKTYYLVTDDGQLIEYLDTIQLGTKATVTGIPFTRGSYDYIQVSNIETDQKLPSLCDEWNVLDFRAHRQGPDEYYMRHYHLTTDTIIGEQRYIQLFKDNAYMGAMREGDNKNIFYIPADNTHEYLLYAFNAQVGDQVTDLWLGSTADLIKDYFPHGINATVEEIRETTPRRFVLSIGFITTEEGVENYPYYFEWIEGIGFENAPDGANNPLSPPGGFLSFLLCAYKNGEQVYVSEKGKTYGCEYNGEEISGYTIPLFARDDSGSSTVDPVDPNQVIAKLREDKLIIREYMGLEITYLLQPNTPIKTPLRNRAQQQSDTFRDEVTIPITESGEYILQLTNPSWDYTIIGQFYYAPQGIKTIQSVSTPQKMLLNGHLYILRGDHIFDTQGKIIK